MFSRPTFNQCVKKRINYDDMNSYMEKDIHFNII
jgi:hypothetical protein